MFGTGWDIMELHEQIRLLMIDTKVLFLLDNGFAFEEIKGGN